eukprot:TRINITY_DN16940_c0_g1_i1.p1 TRINITY_DN16940_c0_g1~~TRINITY_DN16940_c0_g1_i1.p1  ORF type:complete len:1039 (+),score=121.14 TRINITY_DN16940_c0_g1_i1:40-3156(+)
MRAAKYLKRRDSGQQAPPKSKAPHRKKGLKRTGLQDMWKELLGDEVENGWGSEGGNRAKASAIAALRELKDDMGWPVKEIENLSEEGVSSEFERLSIIKNHTMNVLSTIAQREACIQMLMGTLGKCPPTVLKTSPEIARKDHDPYVSSLAKAVQQLRKATVDVLEGIKTWRGALGTFRPFKWRGSEYVQKMQADTSFLLSHHVSTRLLRPEVVSSPLLYTFSTSKSGAATTTRTRRLLAAKDILLYETALSTPVPDMLDLASDTLEKPFTPEPQQDNKEEDILTSPGSIRMDAIGIITTPRSEAESEKCSPPDSPNSPFMFSSPNSPLTPPATECTETERVVKLVCVDSQEGRVCIPKPALSNDKAARRIQQAFRLYNTQRKHQHEDTINEKELLSQARDRDQQMELERMKLREDEIRTFTPPKWQRLASTQYKHCSTFTKQTERAAAASVVQLTWRLIRAGKKRAQALRDDRGLHRAGEILEYHWQWRTERLLKNRERETIAAKYRMRADEEGHLVTKYNRALTSIQRIGRGLTHRLYLREIALLQHDIVLDTKARVLTSAARGMLARRQAARLREDRAVNNTVTIIENSLRHCKAVIIQSWLRGVRARDYAASMRSSKKLDTQWSHNAAAKRIQKAYKIWNSKKYADTLRTRRSSFESSKKCEQLKIVGATKIQWWYRGRTAARAVRQRVETRRKKREDAVTKVGERYRGIKNNAKLARFSHTINDAWKKIQEMDTHSRSALCANVDVEIDADMMKGAVIPGGACKRPASRIEFTASDTDDESSVESCEEVDVTQVLREGHVAAGRRALLLLMLAITRRRLPSLDRQMYDTIVTYHPTSITVSGLLIPQLDLNRARRYEEDVLHSVMNNMLKLTKNVLLRILSGVYGGSAPPIPDKWTIVSVLGRVVLDWGLHAVIGHLEDTNVWKTSLLAIVLHELQFDASEELLSLLRADPLALLYSDKLTRPTLSAICAHLPSHHEDMLLWIHEMGILQVLSTLPDIDIEEITAQLPLGPLPPKRPQQETVVSKFMVTCKVKC